MAAPSPAVRVDPSTASEIMLDDGFSTLITLTGDTDIAFWETSVTPPGIDGGDAIEKTTMHNSTWRTMTPRSLKTLTECSITARYDPAVYSQILARINVEDTITVTFPDGSTYAFFGYVRLFEPQSCEEGNPPEANITIQPTNWDYSNDVEAGPALAEVAGT